jgi:uncharacterized protein (DUF488 family)
MSSADNPTTVAHIFSIGHSNHPIEEFLDLLRLHGIAVLVDVRSAPYSRYVPHFNPENLKATLKERGFQYLYMGRELGGRPEGAELYDADGRVRYDRLAEAPLFLGGLERLITGGGRYRVAMMCSEEDPTHCHRRLLIGRVLRARSVPFTHIRGDGRLQTEAEVSAAEQTPEEAAGQMALFPAEEVTDWKSTRSVSPKKPPPSSSRP